MGAMEYQITKGPLFTDPRSAPVLGQPVEFREQGRSLPVVEDRITVRIQRTKQGKCRLIKACECDLPGQPTSSSSDDLARDLSVNSYVDHAGPYGLRLCRTSGGDGA